MRVPGLFLPWFHFKLLRWGLLVLLCLLLPSGKVFALTGAGGVEKKKEGSVR